MQKYLTQKTQKIVSAIYLITDFIKDNDPLKWEIREEGISLVSSSLLFNTTFQSEREYASKTFTASADKVISFLKIASLSSLVSVMNGSIVINEIESLVAFLNKDETKNQLPGYILSDTFFATDSDANDNKGQNGLLKTVALKAEKIEGNKKNENRKDEIMSLLSKNSNLTIKDFTKVIKNCSEKTIQRELISLMKKGLVKRVGERRWSTYSLV